LQYVLGPPVRGLFRIEVVKSHPLKYGRWILTPNHISGWDPICLAAKVPRPLHFMAKAELRRSLGPLLSLLDISPIARNKPDVRAIKTVRHFLYGEKLVVMYPEGHRHRKMAPVIPVVIKGLENLSFNTFWKKKRKLPEWCANRLRSATTAYDHSHRRTSR